MMHYVKRCGKRLALITLLVAVAACNGVQPGTPGTPVPNSPGEPGGVEAYIMKGQVTDAHGVPLAGVEVFADNTLLYDSNLLASTDANGTYRIDLSAFTTTWHAGATLNATFEGQTYAYSLEPSDDSVFAGVDGAIRNFTWKLTGAQPGGGYYGSVVYVYGDFATTDFLVDDVELTLTPEGPLIDGSAGQSIVQQPLGGEIVDVPIGRYTVTGRYLEPSGSVRPLLIASEGGSDFAASKSVTFSNDGYYGTTMELTVRPQ
jgi:hypothetical protein